MVKKHFLLNRRVSRLQLKPPRLIQLYDAQVFGLALFTFLINSMQLSWFLWFFSVSGQNDFTGLGD